MKARAKSPKSTAAKPGVARPKTKKRKGRARKRAPVGPAPLEIPRRPRVVRYIEATDPVPIDDEQIGIYAMNVARADTWRERKQYICPLSNFFLTYEQLGLLIHRFPSFPERLKAMELLKGSVRDSEHSFYLFSQGFALSDERKAVSNIFRIALID